MPKRLSERVIDRSGDEAAAVSTPRLVCLVATAGRSGASADAAAASPDFDAPVVTIGESGGGRTRELLEQIQPRWILYLRPGERLAPDDQEALPTLISGEPDPSCAYLLRVFPVVDEAGRHYETAQPWSARLFAYDPRHVSKRAPWDDAPRSVSRRIRTTLRIQARPGPVTPTRPGSRSAGLRAWKQRPPGLPLLFGGAYPGYARALGGRPVLSAIVISRNDADIIERAVGSVVRQQCPVPFEVILVTSGSGREATIVRQRFPQVRIVELDRPVMPGEARNAGVAIARGEYVSFPGSHIELPPGSLAARVRAHDLGYAMVTGTMLNATRTLAGWASYFMDNSTVLPGRPSGPLPAAPIRCSYHRQALLSAGGFPEDMRTGEDTVVNDHLSGLGYGAYRSRDITLYHYSPCRSAFELVRHHFLRGRGLGRILFDRAGDPDGGRTLALFVLLGPLVRLRRTWRNVHAWGPEFVPRFRRVLPLVALGILSYWGGCCFELLALTGETLSARRASGRN